MSHLYKTSEWMGSSGYWYVNDIEDLSSVASCWWAPIRLLNITPVDYVQMLIQNFHAKHIKYSIDKNVLLFSFDSQSDARKYKNWINAQARKKHYILD